MTSETGILAFGAYIPFRRLQRSAADQTAIDVLHCQ